MFIILKNKGLKAEVLMENITPDNRIGLSATPHRYFDETDKITVLSWFLPNEAQIFEFSLKDAQDLGIIMHYEYHIYECEFLDSHFEEFINHMRQNVYMNNSRQRWRPILKIRSM